MFLNLKIKSREQAGWLLNHVNQSTQAQEKFVYILGLYLGDGYLQQDKYTQRLRFTLDAKYPNIIEECKQALECITNHQRKINIVVHQVTAREVFCYCKEWTTLIPQGCQSGLKHERDIQLTDLQNRLVQQYPKAFLRGLYHSDGSRYLVNKNIAYSFTNCSDQIRLLFRQTLGIIGVEPALSDASRPNSSVKTVFIYRAEEVEKLDTFLGSKH